jgi:hypothetical protein
VVVTTDVAVDETRPREQRARDCEARERDEQRVPVQQRHEQRDADTDARRTGVVHAMAVVGRVLDELANERSPSEGGRPGSAWTPNVRLSG